MTVTISGIVNGIMQIAAFCYSLPGAVPAGIAGRYELPEAGNWTACRGLMVLTLVSMAMNFFLLFRMMSAARRSGTDLHSRLNEKRHDSVLNYIEDLRQELTHEKERSEKEKRELLIQIDDWKKKYYDAANNT